MLPDFDDDSASLGLCERGGTVRVKLFKDKDVGFPLPRHLSKTWHLKATNFMLDALNSASRQGGQWLNAM